MNTSLKVLHFSDIHIGVAIRHMSWKRWLSKRAIGAINLLRGRSKYFDEARRANDWYELLYTGHPCERWLCYFLVFTAKLDREEMKGFCDLL